MRSLAIAVRGRIERGDEAERLATGHPVVEPGLLGEVADLAAIARAGVDADAATEALPRVGRVSPARILRVVDLPAPLGPRKP